MATMPRFGTDPITLAREWIKQQNAANLQDRRTTDRVKFETAKSLTEPEAARRKQEAINSATMSGAQAAQEQGLEYKGGKTGTARRYGGGTASVGKNASAFEKGLRDGGVNNPYAVAAGLGHAQIESGFNTGAKGDHDKNGNPTAFGGFQWRHERAAYLQRFARENKLDINDPYTHGLFAAHEMQTTEKGPGSMIINAKSLAEANEGYIKYLRPKGAEGGMKTAMHARERGAASEAWMKKISGSKPEAGSSMPSSPTDGDLVPIKPADVKLQIQNYGEDSFKQWWDPTDQVNEKGQILYRRKKAPTNDSVPNGSPGTPPVDPNSGAVKVATADTPVVLAPVAAKKDDDDDFDPDTGE